MRRPERGLHFRIRIEIPAREYGRFPPIIPYLPLKISYRLRRNPNAIATPGTRQIAHPAASLDLGAA